MRSKTVFRSELAPVHRVLKAWLKIQNPRQAIPEYPWRRWWSLGRSHGVSAVSQALWLDYYALKRRVSEPEPASEVVKVKLAPAEDPRRGSPAEMEDR